MEAYHSDEYPTSTDFAQHGVPKQLSLASGRSDPGEQPISSSSSSLTCACNQKITGVNGLVASHTADQFLTYGFKVRGTVRNAQKNDWLVEHFENKYGSGKFELVEVPELDQKGSLDEVIKGQSPSRSLVRQALTIVGCDGIAHTASPVGMFPDPNEVIPAAVNTTLRALEAAAATPSVKRFVFTSSSITTGPQGIKSPDVKITPQSWYDDSIIEAACAPGPYGPDRIFPTYTASKVLAEKEVWKFVAEHKPHFVANSVLPDLVTGAPVAPEQGITSSMMLLQLLITGEFGWQLVGSNYMIDAGDIGRLHVAAMIKDDAQKERVFGYAHQRTWNGWLEQLRELYPGKSCEYCLALVACYRANGATVPESLPNEGRDESTITAMPRAEALLQWLGQPGFRPAEESLKEAADAIFSVAS